MRTLLTILYLLLACEYAVAKKVIVSGVVADSLGKPIENAKVLIVDNHYSLLAKSNTDKDGSIVLLADIVNIDDCAIWVRKLGYIDVQATLSENILRDKLKHRYTVKSYGDTLNIVLHMRTYPMPEKTEGLNVVCVILTEDMLSPKMHEGLSGKRAKKIYSVWNYNK